MELIEKYIHNIEVVERIAVPLLNETSQKEATTTINSLKEQLKETSFIKVPFVGEFNASKSSLLNAYMGVNLLPTNITPETTVSYELYFSTNEKLEVWKYDSIIQTSTLENIKELNVGPGDIVKVYINNERIRQLNERGIVLVDMPGIDSGVEEHNKAILNYIQEGTFYIIVSDIQHGTLTSSSLQFIQELKKYSISAAVLLSKIDRKPEDERMRVIEDIRALASRVIAPDVFVGGVSALSNQIGDLERLLETLNGEQLAEKKFKSSVDGFINKQIAKLEFQANLLASSTNNFDSQIELLNKKREDALTRLTVNDSQAQPIEESVQDILGDIKNELLVNAYPLASSLYANNDAKSMNNMILSILRPVLVNSFKREVGEYQKVIGQTLTQLSDDIEAILRDENNPLVKQAQDIVDNLVGKELLEELLTKGFAALVTRFARYKSISALLNITGKIINPLVGILIGLIPDLLRLIFGKSKSEKISEIQKQLENVAFSQIVEAMREPITNMIVEQRQESFDAIKTVIEDEIDSLNASLNEVKKQKEEDEAINNKKIEALKDAVYQLKFELGLKY